MVQRVKTLWNKTAILLYFKPYARINRFYINQKDIDLIGDQRITLYIGIRAVFGNSSIIGDLKITENRINKGLALLYIVKNARYCLDSKKYSKGLFKGFQHCFLGFCGSKTALIQPSMMLISGDTAVLLWFRAGDVCLYGFIPSCILWIFCNLRLKRVFSV